MNPVPMTITNTQKEYWPSWGSNQRLLFFKSAMLQTEPWGSAKIIQKSLTLKSLPNDNFLDLTKLKAFADDELNFPEMMISLFDRVENTAGKGENVGNQPFLLFQQSFQKVIFPWIIRSLDCVEMG